MGLVQFANDGPLLRSTNYWGTEPASRGLMLLCGNAGALRLLVPPQAEENLAEMRTGRSVTIERSLDKTREVDVVFEDGSDSPFFVSLHREQLVNTVGSKRQIPFYVYTRAGIALRFVAKDTR